MRAIKVQLLEYNGRPGGRNWTLYGGDTYTELGGATQHVAVRSRPVYQSRSLAAALSPSAAFCITASRLGVALEPFIQVNYNAYVHSTNAYGGKPQRYRQVQADFHGHVAELLAKSTKQNALDQAVSKEDREILMLALRNWGALDENYEYRKRHRQFDAPRLYVGPRRRAAIRCPIRPSPPRWAICSRSNLWSAIAAGHNYELQSSIFQPKGGMGMIGKAMGNDLGPLIQYNCKVTRHPPGRQVASP